MPFHSTTIFTLAYLLPLSLAHLPRQKHHLNLLSSITKALLTHTLASFWKKQSCVACNNSAAVLRHPLRGDPPDMHRLAFVIMMIAYDLSPNGRQDLHTLCWLYRNYGVTFQFRWLKVYSIAHVIIIIKSEISTLPVVIIFFRGCVPGMCVTSYSATYCIYIPGKPGFCFHY